MNYDYHNQTIRLADGNVGMIIQTDWTNRCYGVQVPTEGYIRNVPEEHVVMDQGILVERKVPLARLDPPTKLPVQDLLDKWVEWEAKLLNTNEAWELGLPAFTQELYDEYIQLIEQRNKVMEAMNADIP